MDIDIFIVNYKIPGSITPKFTPEHVVDKLYASTYGFIFLSIYISM